MNYGELKANILSVLGRAPAGFAYDLVTADVNQKLRLLCMEATTSLTEAASVTLPTDFLEVIDVYRDTDPRRYLTPVPASDISRMNVTSGTPCNYAIVDGAMLLNPAPDGSETLQLRYTAKATALVSDADTNDVLTNFPSVYVYGALTHHATLIRDQANAGAWFQAYQTAMQQAQGDTNRARSSGPTSHIAPRNVA